MLQHLELYSGIGGMRIGVRAALPPNIQHTVCSIDINRTANHVYNYNFEDCARSKSIEHCTLRDIDIGQQRWQGEQAFLLWTLSPPCQPYTTTSNSKQQDIQDDRASSFSHLLRLLPQMPCPPTHLLLENVPAFYGSRSYQHWRKVLLDLGYHMFDVALCPSQLGMPHRRPRHYTLARLLRNRPGSEFSAAAIEKLQQLSHATAGAQHGCMAGFQAQQLQQYLVLNWSQYSQPLQHCDPEVQQQVQRYALPTDRVARYYKVLDIVTPQSKQSNCFTKGYQKSILGCGSYLMEGAAAQQLCEQDSRGRWHFTQDPYQQSSADESSATNNSNQLAMELPASCENAAVEAGRHRLECQQAPAMRIRAFTPREVANLQGFPASFSFPADVTDRQAYALLGNSVSIDAVTYLAKLLLEDVIASV